jgi:hypothetical protein
VRWIRCGRRNILSHRGNLNLTCPAASCLPCAKPLFLIAGRNSGYLKFHTKPIFASVFSIFDGGTAADTSLSGGDSAGFVTLWRPPPPPPRMRNLYYKPMSIDTGRGCGSVLVSLNQLSVREATEAPNEGASQLEWDPRPRVASWSVR